MRQFGREDFARFHPAGSLGRKLMKVEAVMRQGQNVRLASCHETIRQVITASCVQGRRTGAVMLVDDAGLLEGLFTDSDLARLFEQHREADLDRPISEVMTRKPITMQVGGKLMDAVELLSTRKISELPVVDASGKPVGLIDITDVLGLLPAEQELAA